MRRERRVWVQVQKETTMRTRRGEARRGEAEEERERTKSLKRIIRNQMLENPSMAMAAQIPRWPTTLPTRIRRGPRPHGPQRQPPAAVHRRPPEGFQSDAVRRSGERSGPGEAWIREGPPLGSLAGANRGALPHRRRFALKGRGLNEM